MNLDDAVIVALGSNQALGAASPQQILESALARFPAFGLEVVKHSRWWRSAAWPAGAGPDFVNGVAIVGTELDPGDTLAALHSMEAEFGRERSQVNAPRTLDLDLIAFGREVTNPTDSAPRPLLPHPRAHERLFVVGPLAEIAPAWTHPVLATTAAELAKSAIFGRDAHPI